MDVAILQRLDPSFWYPDPWQRHKDSQALVAAMHLPMAAIGLSYDLGR